MPNETSELTTMAALAVERLPAVPSMTASMQTIPSEENPASMPRM